MSNATTTRLMVIHRVLSVAFLLLMSWSLWTGIMALYADLVRPWLVPDLASAFSRPPATVQATLLHLSERHAIGTEWTLIAPGQLRPFFVYSGRIAEGGAPTNLMVDPASGLELPWNNILADGLLRRLHTDLLLPKPYGRLIMGAAGLVLAVVAASGLFIHGKVIRDAWRWRRRSRLLDLSDSHKRFGFWLLPFLLVMAFSGAMLGMKSVSLPVAALVQNGFSVAATEAALRPPPSLAAWGGTVAEDNDPGSCLRQFAQRRPEVRLGRVARRGDMLMIEGVAFGTLAWAGDGAGAVRAICRSGILENIGDSRAEGWPGAVESALRPIHYARFGGVAIVAVYVVLSILCLWIMDSGMRILWLRDRAGSGRYVWSRRFYDANNALYVLLPLVLLLSNLLTGATDTRALVVVAATVCAAHLLPKLDGPRRFLAPILGVVAGSSYVALPLARHLLHPEAPWLSAPPVLVVDLSVVLFGLWLTVREFSRWTAFPWTVRSDTPAMTDVPRDFGSPGAGAIMVHVTREHGKE